MIFVLLHLPSVFVSKSQRIPIIFNTKLAWLNGVTTANTSPAYLSLWWGSQRNSLKFISVSSEDVILTNLFQCSVTRSCFLEQNNAMLIVYCIINDVPAAYANSASLVTAFLP